MSLSKTLNNKKIKTITYVIFYLFLFGCKPDKLELDLYTSDFDIASTGEIVEVNVKASFSMLGEDDDGNLSKASAIAGKYLSPDSKFTQSEGMMGSKMVIETKIPFGTLDAINNYLKDNNLLLVLIVDSNNKNNLYLSRTTAVDSLDQELSTMNFMLGFEIPAKSTLFNIISDSRDTKKVSAVAVFIDGKPYKYFDTTLNRRDSVEIEFSGEDGSIYKSNIAPSILIEDV